MRLVRPPKYVLVVVDFVVFKSLVEISSPIQDRHDYLRAKLAAKHLGSRHTVRNYRLHVSVKQDSYGLRAFYHFYLDRLLCCRRRISRKWTIRDPAVADGYPSTRRLNTLRCPPATNQVCSPAHLPVTYLPEVHHTKFRDLSLFPAQQSARHLRTWLLKSLRQADCYDDWAGKATEPIKNISLDKAGHPPLEQRIGLHLPSSCALDASAASTGGARSQVPSQPRFDLSRKLKISSSKL
jgi:hypothetical protein